MKILHKITNEVIKEIEGDTLYNADLRYTNLCCADLSDANLRCADLSYTDLRYADLSNPDLSNADLRYADLSNADLSNADLRYADLSNADLCCADLSYVNLSYTNLSYANLSDTKYPILSILKSNFGKLSDKLTLELMRWDAISCGKQLMTNWADGGSCPFLKIKREFYFKEKRELWKPGKPSMNYKELWIALAEEKGIKI